MGSHPFSFSEVHGKHRSPEEIGRIEQQNQIMEARAYHYGDPVNTPGQSRDRQHGGEELRRGSGRFIVRAFTALFVLLSGRSRA
jgi:hypothetical protein